MYRTLVVIGLAACFGQTVAPVIILLGGLVGATLAPSMELATLPISLMIIGTACTSVPAAFLMARVGRRRGFLIASGYGASAALLAAWAIDGQQFLWFCVATFLMGSYLAFMHQARFAVAESVPENMVAKCVSWYMLAGIVAAFLGPEMAYRLSALPGLAPHAGAFLGLSTFIVIAFCVFLFYREAPAKAEEELEPVRPLIEIFGQPVLLLAVASAVVGWSVMSLIMTATPVSMHEMNDHSLADTALVIQSHIAAMFLPSLFSGVLIARFGAPNVIWFGLALMLACIIVGHGSPELIHYWVSLVLLGVGWNFMFLGGTTLLAQTWRSNERFRIQAVNDFAVFGLQALAALGSGVLLVNVGWNGVILLSIPMLLLMIPMLMIARRRKDALSMQ